MDNMATSKEKDASAQVPPTRSIGLGSATGVAIHEEERDDVPSGADRGSKAEIEGTPVADVDHPKAEGAQAEPARFTSNGQLPHNMVPSASGPVPAAAGGGSVEDVQKRIDAANKSHDETYGNARASVAGNKKLSEATVGRLGRAELIAIGQTRGYVMDINGGTRKARNDFLKGQDGDQNITSEEEGTVYEHRAPKAASKRSARKSSKRSR